MYERVPQSAAKTIVVPVYLSSDHLSPATGNGTLQITISKNGAAFGNPGGAGAVYLSEIANGFYSYVLSTADMGTLGPLAVYIADTAGTPTADPVRLIFEVVDPNNAGFAGVPSAAAGANNGLPLGDASGHVTLTTAEATQLTTAAGYTVPSTSAIAAAILTTPANKLTTDSSGNVQANNADFLSAGEKTQLTTAAGYTVPSTSAIAAAILTTPANKLTTDSSGNVQANNADFLSAGEKTQLTTAAGYTVPSTSAIAAAILTTPANKLTTDSSGNVQANNADFLSAGEKTQLTTAAGYTVPSTSAIAAAILTTPANKLTTDSSGNVQANNADFLSAGEKTQLTTAAGYTVPSTSAIANATAALIVSGSPIVVDSHGQVTINNSNVLTSGQIQQLQAASAIDPPTPTEIAQAILQNTNDRLVLDSSGNVSLANSQVNSIAALIVSGSPIVVDSHGQVTMNNSNVLTSQQIQQLQAASEIDPPSPGDIAAAILTNNNMRLAVDSSGHVTANNADFLSPTEQTQLATAAGYTIPSATAIAAQVWDDSPIVTDSSGHVTANNADFLSPTEQTQLATAAGYTIPSATAIAAQVWDDSPIVTDSSGHVTANNADFLSPTEQTQLATAAGYTIPSATAIAAQVWDDSPIATDTNGHVTITNPGLTDAEQATFIQLVAQINSITGGQTGGQTGGVITVTGTGITSSPTGVYYYGTVEDADNYFANRLHEHAWSEATLEDRPKALWAATQIIDCLNFKGVKHTVWELFRRFEVPHRSPFYPEPTPKELREANLAQRSEFPRDSDVAVPTEIVQACYELAHSLLDGRDPELELEALGLNQVAYGQVQSSFNRNQVPLEHLVNGIPNALAWRLIRPFLASPDEIRLTRIG